MKLRRRDKLALAVVAVLATWTAFLVNAAVWEGLFFLHGALHIPIELINYELSVWPVLIDIVILMSTVIWTRQSMQMSDTQSTVLDAQTAQTEAIRLLLQQGVDRDIRVEELLQLVKGRLDDIAEDVDELVEDAPEHAHRAATKIERR